MFAYVLSKRTGAAVVAFEVYREDSVHWLSSILEIATAANIPALLIKISMPPNATTAVVTTLCPPLTAATDRYC